MSAEALPAVISREAGDKTKGFRFQKLRAAVRLLERIIARPDLDIYCALEFIEDSAILAANEPVCVEENKQYSSSLSFNSTAIKNSLVAFLDAEGLFNYSQGLRFGVYASAEIADERVPAELLAEVAPYHSGTMFQLLWKLAQSVELSDVETAVAKRLVADEYVRQYKGRAKDGVVTPPFAKWTLDEFRSFLGKIDWTFHTQDNARLEEQAQALIRQCPFFDHRHEGLESFLLSAITDLLEKRSQLSGHIDRIVGTPHIKLLFLQILAERRDEKVDPAHLEWEKEAAYVVDKRNLSEKIRAVAPAYSERRLARLARKIALARHDKDAFGREYVSLQLRVLVACQDEFEKLAAAVSPQMSDAEVDACLDSLVAASVARMNSLSNTWSYRVANEESIRGAVLTLFDDCFLAFNDAAA